ncbi:ATP synthase subunit I [Psychromonas sp.]|uniref:N-ATPase subunit AtpR n=1 Tax=Psychromonas sp. TaxID=1884585 RepID=UPI00356455B9
MINKMVYENITYEQLLSLLPALFTGLLLGIFFFAGLWWTVRRGAKSERPVIWFFASFILRTTLTLSALYWISDGQWLRLVVCLLGFTVARIVVQVITRSPRESIAQKESGHAP